jgi:hypothetical protein
MPRRWRAVSGRGGLHFPDQRRPPMSTTEFLITCPYCGEDVEIYLEPDTRGILVQDCEVCCNPWQLRVVSDGDDRFVDVSRADGSE